MVLFRKGQTETVVLTLSERQTITDANYLFVFTSRSTNEVVKFVIVNSSDESTDKTRYNQFDIVVNTYFADYLEGWWSYAVFEQASTTNTDPTLAEGLLEKGLMFLREVSSDRTFNTFNNATTFKQYGS
jgi:hypothetical protein